MIYLCQLAAINQACDSPGWTGGFESQPVTNMRTKTFFKACGAGKPDTLRLKFMAGFLWNADQTKTFSVEKIAVDRIKCF